ncbi:MAG: zinc ribbon domain-containing protein [Promethearchaeota archaeon]
MRTRGLMLVFLGFIVLGMGMAVLASSGQGTFFIFPFFFFGESGLITSLGLIGLLFLMVFFFWANSRYPEDVRFSKYHEPSRSYLRVGSQCKICGSPVPENAEFCPSCGSKVEYSLRDNDPFQ